MQAEAVQGRLQLELIADALVGNEVQQALIEIGSSAGHSLVRRGESA